MLSRLSGFTLGLRNMQSASQSKLKLLTSFDRQESHGTKQKTRPDKTPRNLIVCE